MESRAGSFSVVANLHANLHWNVRDRHKRTYDKVVSVEPDDSPTTMLLQYGVCGEA
jgi:hypothetical protein